METHCNPLKVKGESIFTYLAGKKAFKFIYKVEITQSNLSTGIWKEDAYQINLPRGNQPIKYNYLAAMDES